MSLLNKSRKILMSIVCAVFFVCASFFIFANVEKQPQQAYATAGNIENVGNLLGTTGVAAEHFDKDKLNYLVSKLTGQPTNAADPLATVRTLINSNMTASYGYNIVTGSTLYTNAGSKSTVVKLGGYEWVVTSLTQTRTGDPIATLYLANQNGLSVKNSKWSNYSGDGNYPGACYGTSYMRVVTLNAGGKLGTSTSTIIDSAQSSTNDWAKFTMPKVAGSLTKYLATPAEIAYQETASWGLIEGISLPNDCYGTPKRGNWVGVSLHTKPTLTNLWNIWKNDYVWLPSMNETGRTSPCSTSGSNYTGVWGRANAGQLAMDSVPTWIKSGNGINDVHYFTTMTASSLNTDVTTSVTAAYAVRPAIHLNLKKAYEDTTEYEEPNDITITYDGTARTISTLASTKNWYFEDYADTTKFDIQPQQATDSGEYWIKSEIKSSYIADLTAVRAVAKFKGTPDTTDPLHMESDTIRWSKLIIDKKKISLTLGTDTDGLPTSTIASGVIATDTGNRAPQVAFKYNGTAIDGTIYSDSTTPPTSAGTYTATAYIVNDTCNYVLDNTYSQNYVKPKDKVSQPTLDRDGVTTPIYYNGSDQNFTVTNFDATKYTITCADTTNVTISGNTIKIKNAGQYNIEFALLDTSNYEWDGKDSSNIVKVVKITQKLLTISFASKSGFTAVAGDPSKLEFTLIPDTTQTSPAIKITADPLASDNLSLYFYYYNSTNPTVQFDLTNHVAQDPTNVNATIVTFPLNDPAHPFSIGTYVLAVKLPATTDTNKNYNISTASNIKELTFIVKGQNAQYSASTIEWLYVDIADSNPATSTKIIAIDSTTNKGSFDYTGKTYSIKVNDAKLDSDGLEVNINQSGAPNGYSGSIQVSNAGNYTITVYLKVKSGFVAPANMPNSVTLNFVVNKAKYNLSTLEWVDSVSNTKYDATNGLPYNGNQQSVVLNGLSSLNGITPSYIHSSGRILVGNYTSTVSFNITDSANYIRPVSTDANSYVYNNGGKPFEWTLSWKIVKAQLIGDWDTTSTNPSNAVVIPKLKPVGSLQLHDMVIYSYELLGTDGITRTPVTDKNTIGQDTTRACTYFVTATLDSAYQSMYDLTVTEQSFTVGTDKFAVQIRVQIDSKPLQPKYVYTGIAMNVDFTFVVSPPNLKKENVVLTYYKCVKEAKDFHKVDVSKAQLMGTTIPTDVGYYHCVLSLKGSEADGSIIASGYDEFLFDIVPADFNMTNVKWQVDHDTTTATYGDSGLTKWTRPDVDSSNNPIRVEIPKFVFDGKNYMFTLLGFDTLPTGLTATITCDDNRATLSNNVITFTKSTYNQSTTPIKTSARVTVTFTIAPNLVGNYNMPTFVGQTLDITIERALIDARNMQWGYLESDGINIVEKEFKGSNAFTYKRLTPTTAVNYVVKLINVPDALKGYVEYTENDKTNVGVYNATFRLKSDFDTNNYIAVDNIQPAIHSTFTWKIVPIRLGVPKLDPNNTWITYNIKDPRNTTATFDNAEHNLFDILKVEDDATPPNLVNLPTDWELYYSMTITKDGTAYTGLGLGSENMFKDNGTYVISFALLPDSTGKNVFWKDYVSDITLTINKLKVTVTGWNGPGIKAKAETDFIDFDTKFEDYFEYVFYEIRNGQKDTSISYNFNQVAVMKNKKLVKELKILDLFLADANPNIEIVGEISHEFEIGEKADMELVDIPTQKDIVRYTGSLIDMLANLLDYDKNAMEIVEIKNSKGQVVLLNDIINADIYSVKIGLKDKTNFMWKILSRATSTNDDVTIDFEVSKATIKGEWQTINGKPEFVVQKGENGEDYASQVKLTYVDASGNEVDKNNLVAGQKYTAKVSAQDNQNYEIASSDPNATEPVPKEKEFTYNGGSFIDNIMEFVKNNLLFILIGLGALLLLFFFIILAKRRKKKKEEEEKKKQEEAKNNNNNANMGNGNMMGNGPMPMFNPYMQMPMYAQPPQYMAPPQYPNYQNDRLENEMHQLRQEVQNLTKYQTASEEEKKENSRLANVEKMLQQFLMTNFQNNPNWVPFNNQDMINYDLNELMKIYSQAKMMAQNNVANAKPKEQQIIVEQAKDFEDKINEYNKQKSDSQYEELLREMREKFSKIEADNKELKEKLENSEKHQTEKELEGVKQELLKRENELNKKQEELERSHSEIENLKEKTLNDKLDEALKKNDFLTTNKVEEAPIQNFQSNQNVNELEKMKEELLRKESELEKRTSDFARSQEELSRKQGELESLKAQNEKQEKLVEELVKKNETITTKSNDNLNTTTNLIVNTAVSNGEKIEFSDAFNYLKDEQKEYFKQLRDYALSKPNARIKPTKYNFTVGVGNTTFVKFVVKYSTLIATFGTTEIKLEDQNAFDTAKLMIDNKVNDYLNKLKN